MGIVITFVVESYSIKKWILPRLSSTLIMLMMLVLRFYRMTHIK